MDVAEVCTDVLSVHEQVQYCRTDTAGLNTCTVCQRHWHGRVLQLVVSEPAKIVCEMNRCGTVEVPVVILP